MAIVNTVVAFALVALGMLLNQFYNWLAWKKYYEGRRDGRAEPERKSPKGA